MTVQRMRSETLYSVDCCGCSACALLCPTRAIHMEYKDGSYRPTIDFHSCINCGKCVTNCQAANSDFYSTAKPIETSASFVAIAKDKRVLKRSSSGGVGKLLSDRALRSGNACCGAIYSESKERCEHRICTSAEEVQQTQGSKYLQSANEDAFRKIVEMGCGTVIGTPCQIAGIDRVLKLKGIRDKYLLVDIFCHGVPNQLLWKNHLTYLKKKRGVPNGAKVVFRENKKFALSVGNYFAWYNEDAFYTFFLRGWLYNKSCYACYLRRRSFADIRIGDCLIAEFKKLSYSPSSICILTKSGMQALNEIWNDLDIYEIPFHVVDSVQEKENRAVPSNIDELIATLRSGEYPEEVISKTLLFGRIKSLVKNRVLSKVFCGVKSAELGKLVGHLVEEE